MALSLQKSWKSIRIPVLIKILTNYLFQYCAGYCGFLRIEEDLGSPWGQRKGRPLWEQGCNMISVLFRCSTYMYMYNLKKCVIQQINNYATRNLKVWYRPSLVTFHLLRIWVNGHWPKSSAYFGSWDTFQWPLPLWRGRY